MWYGWFILWETPTFGVKMLETKARSELAVKKKLVAKIKAMHIAGQHAEMALWKELKEK